MKSKFFLLAVCFAAFTFAIPEEAHAKRVRGSTGIGLGGGNFSSGLSLKSYMGDALALQATATAWYFGVNNGVGGLAVTVDGLIEMPALADPGPLEIAWNAGAGAGAVVTGGGIGLGVNGVVGLEFNFHVLPTLPFDVVLEWRPTFYFFNGLGLNLFGGSGHIRLYLF